MPWCPNCKAEYRDGFSVCSDCGVSLIDECRQEPQALQGPAFDDSISAVLLIETNDSIEADMLIAILESEGICTMKKIKSAGGYLQLYMGNLGTTIFGAEIYVSSEDFAHAEKLIETYYTDNKIEDEPEEKKHRYKIAGVAHSIDELSTLKTKNNDSMDFEKRKRVFITGLFVLIGLNLIGLLFIIIMIIWNYFA